jgi:hypothetical protein
LKQHFIILNDWEKTQGKFEKRILKIQSDIHQLRIKLKDLKTNVNPEFCGNIIVTFATPEEAFFV